MCLSASISQELFVKSLLPNLLCTLTNYGRNTVVVWWRWRQQDLRPGRILKLIHQGPAPVLPGAETGIYNCLVVVIIMLTSCYSNGPTARMAVAAQIILSYPPVGATLIYCIVPSSEPRALSSWYAVGIMSILLCNFYIFCVCILLLYTCIRKTEHDNVRDVFTVFYARDIIIHSHLSYVVQLWGFICAQNVFEDVCFARNSLQHYPSYLKLELFHGLG